MLPNKSIIIRPPRTVTVPIITKMQSSVIVGQGVHVHALTSTLASGTWLTCNFVWSFGDSGGTYNSLRGWNAGHIYDTPGTYTISLSIIDGTNTTHTVSTSVTVTADTRTIIYVDSAGSDSNNGLTTGTAVKTADKAFSLLADNTKILFKRGETFTVDTTLYMNGVNQALGAYGSGELPVLNFVATDGSEVIVFLGTTSSGVTIQNIAFDSPNAITTGPADDLSWYGAVWLGGFNNVVCGCTFNNVADATNGTQQPTGVIVQDCMAPLLKGMRGYLCWVDGTDWAILGNSVTNTTRAHCVRVNSAVAARVLVSTNNLTKQYPEDDPGEAQKTTVNVRIGSYVYVTNNVLSESTCGISYSPGQTSDQIVNWCVWERNYIHNGQLVAALTGHHVMLRDNVLDITGTGQIALTPFNNDPTSGIPGAAMSDVTVMYNTGINTTADGELLDVFGEMTGGTLTIDNNLFSAPGISYGTDYNSGMFWLAATTTNVSISNNIWPDTNSVELTGVVNNKNNTYLSKAAWLALSSVSNDKFSNAGLSMGSYQITVSGVTAGARNVATYP